MRPQKIMRKNSTANAFARQINSFIKGLRIQLAVTNFGALMAFCERFITASKLLTAAMLASVKS